MYEGRNVALTDESDCYAFLGKEIAKNSEQIITS